MRAHTDIMVHIRRTRKQAARAWMAAIIALLHGTRYEKREYLDLSSGRLPEHCRPAPPEWRPKLPVQRRRDQRSHHPPLPIKEVLSASASSETARAVRASEVARAAVPAPHFLNVLPSTVAAPRSSSPTVAAVRRPRILGVPDAAGRQLSLRPPTRRLATRESRRFWHV